MIVVKDDINAKHTKDLFGKILKIYIYIYIYIWDISDIRALVY